jgi:hypothetical protein
MQQIGSNRSNKEVFFMPTSSRPPLNFSELVLLRWMFKAFLLGLFVGAVAAISALLGR